MRNGQRDDFLHRGKKATISIRDKEREEFARRSAEYLLPKKKDAESNTKKEG